MGGTLMMLKRLFHFLGFPRPLMFPEPPAYKEGVGGAYARLLAENGQRQAYRLTVRGWIFIILAGAFALLATTARTELRVVQEDKANHDVFTLKLGTRNWLYAHAGIAYGALSIVLAGIGWQALDRATAAALLASASTTALGHLASSTGEGTDLNVYGMCVQAKADWLEGRINHDRIGTITHSFFGGSQKQPPPVAKVQGDEDKPGALPDAGEREHVL
jgi:hypothetical protein